MASTYLTRAATGSVTSDKIFTMSVWLKRSSVTGSGSADHWFMHENASSHTQKLDLHFTDDEFRMGWWDGSSEYNLDSKMKFRDTNAWYHIVFRCDTTQATASNRVRVYVNGEQIELQQIGGGSPDSQQPAQNATMNLGQKIICIGRYQASSPSQYFNGCMSHMHYCDGQSYAPTEFGETDSTTGEWKIKPDPSLTYGNNGFWLFKNDNAVTNRAAGTSSGDFTVSGGTFTKTEDNPSNVFATFSSLNVPTSNTPTFAAGNTDLDSCGNAGLFHGSSTLGMSSGKFYAEFKWKSNNYAVAGVSSRARNDARENKRPGAENGSYGFELYNGNVKVNNSTIGGFSGSSLSIGDILCIAIDCDNNKLYFRKNGDAWMNSGDPTSGSTGTGALSLTAATGGDYDGFWFFVIGDGDTSSSSKISANFGNGYFLTTAVSSAGSNASGIGIFEYDVPAGYTALCTKGLNE